MTTPTETTNQLINKIKEDLSKRISEKRLKHTGSVVETALKFANHFAELDLGNFEPTQSAKLKIIKDTLTPTYIKKIETAAWLHDCCKELKGAELLKLAEFYKIKVFEEDIEFPNVLHARVGAAWLEEEYEIVDPHITLAVKEHTLGGNNMLLSSKILYLADMLEPFRDAKEKAENPELITPLDKVRNMIFEEHDLDKALLQSMNLKLQEVLDDNKLIHPLSVESRNNLLKAI